MGIVWIKMNSNDTIEVVQKAVKNFDDPRIEQFYDPLQKSGNIIAKNLPVKAMIAWDIYLFYKNNDLWNDNIPAPVEWMHQMSDTDNDCAHLRCGDDLVKGLYDAMREMTI